MENLTKQEFDEYRIFFERLMQNIQYELTSINSTIQKVESSMLAIDTKLVKSKTKAAIIADCSPQDITTMLKEGRIINYGKGKGDYRFRHSELLNLREIRIEK